MEDKSSLLKDYRLDNVKGKLLYDLKATPEQLKSNLISLCSINREYEQWVHLLLNIINQEKHAKEVNHDFGTPLHKNLEKIENNNRENIELAKKLIKETEKVEIKENYIKELENLRELLKEDFINFNQESLLQENDQLKDVIHSTSEELESLNLEFNKLKSNKKREDLLNKIIELDKENKELEKIKNLKMTQMINLNNCDTPRSNFSKSSNTLKLDLLSCFNRIDNENENTLLYNQFFKSN